MGQSLFIAESLDGLVPSPQGWVWLKPTEGGIEVYEFDEGSWVLEASIPYNTHSHEGLDQLPDIITLLEHGITGSKTIGGYKFTFNHGVLVGFEEV